MLSKIWVLVKFLPELVSLLKTIIELTEKGVTEIKVKRKIRSIDRAFKAKTARERSQALNDAFLD